MIPMARTYRKRYLDPWLEVQFGPTPVWRQTRDASPRHCLCHAGARKHRRLTRKVARQQVRRLLHQGDHVTPSFLTPPAAYY